MPGTRKLGRPTDHRRSMLRGLVTYLLETGRVETTVSRAKEVRAVAEKMITLAKDSSLASKRKALAYITKEDVVKKLFDEIALKYADVNGGYCRLVKTGPRRGDAAEMCIIELIGFEKKSADKKADKKANKKKADSTAQKPEKKADSSEKGEKPEETAAEDTAE